MMTYKNNSPVLCGLRHKSNSTTLLPLCTSPAKTLHLPLTPEPSAIASTLLGGDAPPIPAQGCHLLAESGLSETGPLQRLQGERVCVLNWQELLKACGKRI